jgi:hypothetical protein
MEVIFPRISEFRMVLTLVLTIWRQFVSFRYNKTLANDNSHAMQENQIIKSTNTNLMINGKLIVCVP